MLQLGATMPGIAATASSRSSATHSKRGEPALIDTLDVEEIGDWSNDDIFQEVLALILMADYQRCLKIVKSQRIALLPKVNGIYSLGNVLLHACAMSLDHNDDGDYFDHCAQIESHVMDANLALLVK